MTPSSDLQVTKYFSANAFSSQVSGGVNDTKPDATNIEEAESSLRDSDSLNYEEARVLLGRYEYQKGNVEAALRVFEGIDIAAAIPKMKISLSMIGKPDTTRRSQNYGAPPFSINTVSLLLEAAYLKSKSLQNFGRYREAADSCKIILDIIESSFPVGFPEHLGADHKLKETLCNTIKLLPELFQLADSHHEAILSFRRILLHRWNIDKETTANIQKQFAVFLLYGGGQDGNPPNLRFQTEGSFVPRNNTEEAILLLMILLRKASLNKIKWDSSVFDHLSYALSVSGGLGSLGEQLEELLPGVIDNDERRLLLALCCYGEGDRLSALNLLRNSNCGFALLLASKIHGEGSSFNEGISTAKRAIDAFHDRCDGMVGVAYSSLGVLLSAGSRSVGTDDDAERVKQQSEALESLETAGRLTGLNDASVLYRLSLENAEQRKLDVALCYAKRLLILEGGSHVNGWMLLARILSAQKQFKDGEIIVDAALDQTGKWDQGELLRTKAKLQLARKKVKHAIQTYTQLLAILQVQHKSFGSRRKNLEIDEKNHRRLEMETWNDLATVYISVCKWEDAEACLLKSKAICNYSASTRHTEGLLYEAKGLHKQALKAYKHALDADPGHVPSLVSIAGALRKLGGRSGPVARSFLNEALHVDRMSSSAWYNLGLLLRDESPTLLREAADCFEAATVLKETEPIEPFK